MATKAKDKPAGSAPHTRYEDDLYTWVQEQVALLHAGRFDEVDIENIAEELRDVGRSELRELRSSLAVLLHHLLKWDHQPKRRSLSWVATINEQRRRVSRAIKDSPGLKSKLGETIVDAFASGRDLAVAETGLDYDVFPEACPYTFEEMMSREIVFVAPAAKPNKR